MIGLPRRLVARSGHGGPDPRAPRASGARGGLYYGWVLVLALGATETVSWGILYYAFSVFVRPMEAELGWSRAAVSGAFSLAVLLSGVAAVPVGRWLDRRGPRALMTAGSVAGTLLLLAWAGVRDLVTPYAVWAGIGLVMAAVLYEPAFAVVAVWFRRRRARALTALTDPDNRAAPGANLAPFFIGFTVAVLISLFAPITQAGWNPARDLGPRLVALALGWGEIAVPGPRWGFLAYLIGPLVGGPIGGWLYVALLETRPPEPAPVPLPADAAPPARTPAPGRDGSRARRR